MLASLILFVIFLSTIALVGVVLWRNSALYIRRNGIKTIGYIRTIEVRTYSGAYGRRYFKKFIAYEFSDQAGRSQQGEHMLWEYSPKTLSYLAIRIGDPVTVYYLPNRPSKQVVAIAPDVQ